MLLDGIDMNIKLLSMALIQLVLIRLINYYTPYAGR